MITVGGIKKGNCINHLDFSFSLYAFLLLTSLLVRFFMILFKTYFRQFFIVLNRVYIKKYINILLTYLHAQFFFKKKFEIFLNHDENMLTKIVKSNQCMTVNLWNGLKYDCQFTVEKFSIKLFWSIFESVWWSNWSYP